MLLVLALLVVKALSKGHHLCRGQPLVLKVLYQGLLLVQELVLVLALVQMLFLNSCFIILIV
jgi:hypothetical protein